MDERVASVESPGTARRFGRRVFGLALGLALPTGVLSWVFGFDVIKKRINGRLWCAKADQTVFDVNVRSSGGATRYSDTLQCRKDGVVIGTIGDVRMTATTIGAAFVVSMVLLGLLVAVLWTYSKLRHRRAGCHPKIRSASLKSLQP